MRKKYAVVGTGGCAGGMFIYPVASEYREEAQLVGFCDPSRLRMQHHVDELRNNRGCEDPLPFMESMISTGCFPNKIRIR